MSETMVVQGSPAPAVPDLDQAYKLGRLCGEVRILKWGAGAAVVAILGCMGVLYEAIDDIRVELIETRKDVSVLQADTASIRKDVSGIEEDVAVLKEDVAVLKKDVAVLKEDVAVLKEDLKAMHSSWMEDAHGHHGNSRGFPKHADSAGEPVPPARTTPPA